MQQQLKMFYRLFKETKMQQQINNIAPFRYGKQNAT